MKLFTYGSLMFPAVWERVTGLTGAGQPARLEEHAARQIRGVTYPALVAAPDEATEGVLYAGVTPEALARLDAFEGKFYERVRVVISLPGGVHDSAWVYRAAQPESPDILPDRWDGGQFASRHLEDFLQDDPGFSGTDR